MNNLPLVSCIMPTFKRHKYMLRAIKYFESQTYANKELIIIDDSPGIVDVKYSNIPKHNNIMYIKLPSKRSIGYKRNLALRHAKGTIFMFWDDDDYYSKTRIAHQIKPIVNNLCDITVFNSIVYYDSSINKCFKTSAADHKLIWHEGFMGGSLTCRSSLLDKVSFKNKSIAEDRDFMIDAKKHGAIIKGIPNKMHYIYTRHSSNSFDIPSVKRYNVPFNMQLCI
jgi:glycosyltransferase involved in cell wall biosynthesis